MGFPGGLAGKESAHNMGDLGSIPGLGRSPGEGNGYPLPYSGLKNSMDCIVHGVTKSQTRLRDFHLTSLHLSIWIWFVDQLSVFLLRGSFSFGFLAEVWIVRLWGPDFWTVETWLYWTFLCTEWLDKTVKDCPRKISDFTVSLDYISGIF